MVDKELVAKAQVAGKFEVDQNNPSFKERAHDSAVAGLPRELELYRHLDESTTKGQVLQGPQEFLILRSQIPDIATVSSARGSQSERERELQSQILRMSLRNDMSTSLGLHTQGDPLPGIWVWPGPCGWNFRHPGGYELRSLQSGRVWYVVYIAYSI